MKRVTIATGILIGFFLLLYFGFPSFVDGWIRWQHWRMEEAARIEFSEIGPPTSAPLQPGLSFLEEFDTVRFQYLTSFRDDVEIIARRPFLQRQNSPVLITTVTRPAKTGLQVIHESEIPISEEVFKELQGYVIRSDVLEKSYSDYLAGADGTTWYLEGQKGDLTIRHHRWVPQDYDLEFAAIGKRFLELAEIELDNDEY